MPSDPKLHFRAILVDILDRLTANERKKLSFLLIDDIERQISDDPTIGGTLNVFQQLIDRDKISEENFSYLIEAFKAIKCYQAAKSLTKLQKNLLKNQTTLDSSEGNTAYTDIAATIGSHAASPLFNEILPNTQDDKMSSVHISPMNGHQYHQTTIKNTVNSVLLPIRQLQNQTPIMANIPENGNSFHCHRECLLLTILFTALAALFLLAILFFSIKQVDLRTSSSTSALPSSMAPVFSMDTTDLRESTTEEISSTPTSRVPILSTSPSKKINASTISTTEDERCLLPHGNSCTAATPDETKAAGLGVYYQYPCGGVGCNFYGNMCRLCANHPSLIDRPYPKCPACVPGIESF